MKENENECNVDVWEFTLDVKGISLCLDGNDYISVTEMDGCCDGYIDKQQSRNMIKVSELFSILNEKSILLPKVHHEQLRNEFYKELVVKAEQNVKAQLAEKRDMEKKIGELNVENARLNCEVELLKKTIKLVKQ